MFDPPPWAVYDNSDKNQKILNNLAKIAMAVPPVANARIASCIVIKNDVIAYGVNKRKSHPFQKKFGRVDDAIFLHAENDCIYHSLKTIDEDELRKSTLYICRVKYSDCEKKSFTYGIAKPCAGCQRAIATYGIKKVVYSLDEMGYDYL